MGKLRNIKFNKEKLPEEKKTVNGSDKTWFGGSYTNVLAIYNGIKENGIIKKDDKDYYGYFTNKFFPGISKKFS